MADLSLSMLPSPPKSYYLKLDVLKEKKKKKPLRFSTVNCVVSVVQKSQMIQMQTNHKSIKM